MRRPLFAALFLAGCAGITPNNANLPTPKTAMAFSIGQQPLSVAAAGGDVYCACEGGSAVEVYGITDGKVIKHMPLDNGGKPSEVRTFIDRRQVLVQDSVNGKLQIIDAGSAAVSPGETHVTPPPVATQLIATLDVGKGPARLAFGEENTTVLSSAGNDDKLVLFTFDDERTKAPQRQELTVGAPSSDGRARPIDFKGGVALTADFATKQILTINAASGARQTLTTVGDVGPVAFGLNQVGAQSFGSTVKNTPIVALAADPSNDSVTLIDLTNQSKTVLTDLGKGIRDLIVDDSQHRAFAVMHDSSEVAVIDFQSKQLVARVPVGQGPTTVLQAAPVAGEYWVAGDKGLLTVLNGTGDKPSVKATYNLGAGDHRMTFFGTSGFVTNQTDGTLSIIDRTAIPL